MGGLSVGDRQRGGERGALGKLRERIADKGKPKVPSVVRAAQQLEDVGAWQAGDLDALSDDGAPGGGGTNDGPGEGGGLAGGTPSPICERIPSRALEPAAGRAAAGGLLGSAFLPSPSLLLCLLLLLPPGAWREGAFP